MPRLLSLALAAAVGLVGALVVASPASAHHSTASPAVNCANGQYTITWTVSSVAPSYAKEWKLLLLTGGGTVTVKAEGGSTNLTVPTGYQATDTDFIVTQVLPGNATTASISTKAKWKRVQNGQTTYFTESKKDHDPVQLGGNCVAEPQPTVSYADQCNGTVDVTLINTGKSTPTKFVVNGTSYQVGANTTAKQSITATTVTVTVGGVQIGLPHDWKLPRDCAPVTTGAKLDCDKLTVLFQNPQGVPATYKVVVGDKTVTGTIPSGDSETEAFAATTGTSAVVTVNDGTPETINWERPETCATTTSPALADTGNDVNGVVGIGAGLLAGGIGLIALLFVMRRRRTTAAG